MAPDSSAGAIIGVSLVRHCRRSGMPAPPPIQREIREARMPLCRCGNEFSEARAKLGFTYCLECGKKEAAAEIARRAHMIAPISHKSGYTYLGSDKATQRQHLLEG